MKKLLLVFLMTITGINAFSRSDKTIINTSTDQKTGLLVNSLDTIVFDISQAVTMGTYVEIPVSFISDDTIVAVDFSFKYNQLNFLYDSILDLTNYLQQLSYYNPNDSVVRFTSYSTQTITNDTALVMIRFNTLFGQFCMGDMNTVKGYLNGDACSVKVVNCIPTGLPDENQHQLLSIYPNPAGEILNIKSEFNSSISLLDICGRQVTRNIELIAGVEQKISVANLANGIYFIQESGNTNNTVEKIVIAK